MMAFRQAGHALVGKLVRGTDPIHKVTIIPHGDALGITQQLPTEDVLTLSQEAVQGQMTFSLGGRAAEELIFGQITTGSASGIEVATALARQMACEWGMSRAVGPLAHGRPHQGLRGSRFGRRAHAEQTAIEIDAEVRRLVLESHERARQIVRGNLDKLHLIAQALLELETIDGAEVDVLLAGGKITRAALPARRQGARKDAAAPDGELDPLMPVLPSLS
jgi:cell division protease FtsH